MASYGKLQQAFHIQTRKIMDKILNLYLPLLSIAIYSNHIYYLSFMPVARAELHM